MQEFEEEKKKINMETNWKLRVLNEQEREEKKKIEAANTLLEFAEQARKEVAQKKRQSKAKKTIQDKKTEMPVRRSNRLKAKLNTQ